MNDLEQRLKDVLESDASKAPRVARAPEGLKRDVRRRQVGTALIGTFAIVALLGMSLAGFQAIDRSQGMTPIDDTWAGYDVFERTAVIGTLSITSASDLYLVRPAQDARCNANFDCQYYEALQLSNFDPGLAGSACGAPVPAGGAVLALRMDVQRIGQNVDDPEFPVTFDPAFPVADGPCGPGRYMRFAVDDFPYYAWIGTGEGATDADVHSLVRAFDSIKVVPLARQLPSGGRYRAAYVVAGGENAAGPWRLEVRPSVSPIQPSNVEMLLIGSDGGPAIEGFDVPGAPIEQAGGDPTFGAVTKSAASVEIGADGIRSDATIMPLPPSLPFDFDLFFASYEGDVAARAVALDADGDVMGAAIDEGPSTNVNGEGSYVVARFDAFGARWELSISRGSPGCSVDLRNLEGGPGGGSSCGGIGGSSGSHGPPNSFFYGPLNDGAVTAEVVTDDGRAYPAVAIGTTPDGRTYFVVAVEGAGPGTVRMLDDQGGVVRSSKVDWPDYGQVIGSRP